MCGNAFDRGLISRLLTIYGNTPRRSSITTSEEECSRIEGEIASVNPNTPITRLDHVHTQGRYFLESQPRNLVCHSWCSVREVTNPNAVIPIKFKSLDAQLNLLEYLLQAKHALLAQNTLVDSLTEEIHQVRAEKESLQLRLENQNRRHTQDMNSYLSQLIRADE